MMNLEKYEKKNILSHFWSDVFHQANHVETATLCHEANSNRQEVTGNLTDSLSRVGLQKNNKKRSRGRKLKHAMFFQPYFAKAALESGEQLAALMCPHLRRQVWAPGRRKKVERDGEAAEAKLAVSGAAASRANPYTCVAY